MLQENNTTFENKEYTFEQLMPYWEKIGQAMQNALVIDFETGESDEIDQSEAAFIQGQVNIDVLPEQSAEIPIYRTMFPDLETLRACLIQNPILCNLLKVENINEFIAHEYEHLAKAKELGYEASVALDVAKTPDDHPVFIYSILVHTDLDGDVEKMRRDLKTIAGAPQNLSASDRKKI